MNIDLPKIDRYKAISITNFYGANYLARDYIGISKDRNIINRYWSHGWTIPERMVHPEIITSEPIEKENTLALVGRVEEEEYLKSLGYPAKAIGLPFCYVPAIGCSRIQDSLLVMPSHSTRDLKVIKTDKYINFIKYIREQSKWFNEVLVCMHKDDIDLGFHHIWVENGFAVECGAMIDDKNSLLRMKTLFSTFSVMITDTMGSHVPYAASCGIRIAMRKPEGIYNDYTENQYFIDDPSRLGDDYIQEQDKAAWYSHYRFLFCNPRDAGTHVEWGRKQIGLDNKLTPLELREVLGWSSPRFEYDLLIHNKNRIVSRVRRIFNMFSAKGR